jgi:hypothetical protein
MLWIKFLKQRVLDKIKILHPMLLSFDCFIFCANLILEFGYEWRNWNRKDKRKGGTVLGWFPRSGPLLYALAPSYPLELRSPVSSPPPLHRHVGPTWQRSLTRGACLPWNADWCPQTLIRVVGIWVWNLLAGAQNPSPAAPLSISQVGTSSPQAERACRVKQWEGKEREVDKSWLPSSNHE